jgi:hypothetical protein
MGKELDNFLAFASDPAAYKDKLAEFSASEQRALEASAKADKDTASATARLREAAQAEDVLQRRRADFERLESSRSSAMDERSNRLDAQEIRNNEKASVLAKQEADLKQQALNVQAREAAAEAKQQAADEALRKSTTTRTVYLDTVRTIMAAIKDAQAKIGA